MKFQLLATIVAGAFATSVLAAPSVDPELAVRANENKENEVAAVDAKSLASIEFLLDEILSIPDEVLLKGDKATDEWLAENPFSDPDLIIENALSQRDIQDEEGVILERGLIPKAIKCAAAIADLLIGHIVPASKILKIKKLIKAVGGVKKAVKLLLKAKTKAQIIKLGGSALWNLYKEISGIASVKRNCFK